MFSSFAILQQPFWCWCFLNMNLTTLAYMGFLMNRDTLLVMYVITHIVLATSSETVVDMWYPRP